MGAINEIKNSVKNAVRFGSNSTPWEKSVIKAIQIKFPVDSLTTNDEGYSLSMKAAGNSEKFRRWSKGIDVAEAHQHRQGIL